MTVGEQEKEVNEKIEQILVMPISFERNQTRILPEGREVVGKIAELLQNNPFFTILCEGHAGGEKSQNDDHRMNLSAERSEVCKNILQDQGVTNEIVTAGYGSKYGLGMCVKMRTISKVALLVKVTGAKALKNPHYFGKIDPQVVVKLSKDKVGISEVHKGGHQTPIWNFEKSFTWAGEALEIVVAHINDQGKATTIGRTVLNLSDMRNGGYSGDVDLFRNMSKKVGTISIAISWP